MQPGTLRAYGPALVQYCAYCRERGWSDQPDDVDGVRLAEWLASLAQDGALKSSTIGAYRSAVSSWAKRATLSDAPAAGSSTAVTLCMQGIINQHKPAEVADRQSVRDLNPPLTPPMLAAIVGVAPGSSPRAAMLLAAAHTAVYGLLRPSELLGQPKAREVRALRLGQIAFFQDADGLRRVAPLERGSSSALARASKEAIPHHFELRLGATKADQAGENAPIVVAAAPAVRALWMWIHMRCDLRPLGHMGPFIFLDPEGGVFLTEANLCRQLTVWGKQAGVIRLHQAFKGRSFRRGGAAQLMQSGASIPDMQAAGRWASAAMPSLYAGSDAIRQRRMLVSKSMAPTPAVRGDRA